MIPPPHHRVEERLPTHCPPSHADHQPIFGKRDPAISEVADCSRCIHPIKVNSRNLILTQCGNRYEIDANEC